MGYKQDNQFGGLETYVLLSKSKNANARLSFLHFNYRYECSGISALATTHNDMDLNHVEVEFIRMNALCGE